MGGFYDIYNKSLLVAVKGQHDADVAVAGVTYRTEPLDKGFQLCLALSIHTYQGIALNTVQAGLRVDFLNGTATPLMTFEMLTASANHSTQLWPDEWFPTCPRVQSSRLPQFSVSGTSTVALPLSEWAADVEGWATADHEKRRLRLSVVVVEAGVAPGTPLTFTVKMNYPSVCRFYTNDSEHQNGESI